MMLFPESGSGVIAVDFIKQQGCDLRTNLNK
jgi:hypothetical protein